MTRKVPAATDARGHELAMHLRAASAHLRRQSNRVFGSFGMTTDQFVLLTVLAREGEATQQELAARCYSDTATIGAMVALLETKRWVERTPHPQDGRAWRVTLTASGRALAEAMRRRSAPLRARLANLFTESEFAQLLALLERLAGALRPPQRISRKPDSTRPRRSRRRLARRL